MKKTEKQLLDLIEKQEKKINNLNMLFFIYLTFDILFNIIRVAL